MDNSNEIRIKDGKIFIDDKEIHDVKHIYINDDDSGIKVSIDFLSKGMAEQ